MKKTCVICGKEFEPHPYNRSVCYDQHSHACPVCGKIVYTDDPNRQNCTCSRKCGSQQANESRARSNLKKYGVVNVSQISEVKTKISENLKAVRPITVRTKICEVCGKEFILQHPYTQHTCSAKCRGVYRKQSGIARQVADKAQETVKMRYGVSNIRDISKPVKLRTCADCGKEFLPRTFRQMYCDGPHYGACPICGKQVEIKDRSVGPQACSDACRVKRIEQTMETKYGVAVAFQSEELMHGCYNQISSNNLKFQELLANNNIDSELEFRIGRRSYDVKVGKYLIEIDPTCTHNSYESVFKYLGGSPLDPEYHKLKSTLAKSNNYRCIHVFDWDDPETIVTTLLLPKEKIHARKCHVKKIDELTAIDFTSKYHIQGSCKGQKVNYGLFYLDELVEVMTFGKPRYSKKHDWELLRLCSRPDKRVVGGASKLFKAFTNENSGSIISYCDLSKFNGDVYEAIGMTLDHISDPAKVWSKGNDHITDNLLRQRGYDQLFKTDFGKGTSNEQLMLMSGWRPVYDCGQAVYVYKEKGEA